jgi:hypothetical protein
MTPAPPPHALAEVPAEVVDWVERLHDVVDELAGPVAAAHASRLTCRAGCHDCCTDGLSVFTIEAAVIARHHAALLASGAEGALGGCAFLDARGECRIYAQRPYVCRTQGLPLRWLDYDEQDEPCEVRDICPRNAEGPALEELPSDACWTLGPFEERLATRQAAVDGDRGQRVALRELFAGARRHLPVMR